MSVALEEKVSPRVLPCTAEWFLMSQQRTGDLRKLIISNFEAHNKGEFHECFSKHDSHEQNS